MKNFNKFMSELRKFKSFDLTIKYLSNNRFWDIDDLVIDFLKYFDLVKDKKYFLCDLLKSPIPDLNLDEIPFKIPEDSYRFEIDNIIIFNEHRIINNEICKIIEEYIYSYLPFILKFFREINLYRDCKIVISLFYKTDINFNALTHYCKCSQQDYKVFDLYFNLIEFNRDTFFFGTVPLLKVLMHEFVHVLLDSIIVKYLDNCETSLYNQNNLLIHEGLASLITKDFEDIPDDFISHFIENFDIFINKLKNKKEINYEINLLGLIILNYFFFYKMN